MTNTQNTPVVHLPHGVELPIVSYRNQPVITLAMMDQAHQRPEGTARRTFNTHQAKLIKDEDYYKVSANEIRTHKLLVLSSKTHENIVLLTESGYLMLVKSFTDELAWQVQRQLVKTYFRVREYHTPYKTQPSDTLTQEQADTLRNMLREAVNKLPKGEQAPAMIQGWSKLKAHFGVHYRNIPQAEFLEAVSILSRHLVALKLSQDTGVTNLRITQPNGQWLLDFDEEKDKASLQHIQQNTLLIEPQYLFKLVEAAETIQAFDQFFGLTQFYGALRESKPVTVDNFFIDQINKKPTTPTQGESI